MANLLSIKRRIGTARNVSKTTKALQMISASKLKRAQDAALSSRPYVDKLTAMSENLKAKIEKDDLHAYMKQLDLDKSLTVVISPDKGLSGALTTNLSKIILKNETKTTSYIVIGKKLEGVLTRLGREVVASFAFGITLPGFEMIYPVLQIVDDLFLNKKVSNVNVIYTQFQSVFRQEAIFETILPIKAEAIESKPAAIFEPEASVLLPDILRHYIEIGIYQKILESYASEQAARMIAMKNATDNANDVIQDLLLEFNKGRQEKITNEILDIGSTTFVQSE